MQNLKTQDMDIHMVLEATATKKSPVKNPHRIGAGFFIKIYYDASESFFAAWFARMLARSSSERPPQIP